MSWLDRLKTSRKSTDLMGQTQTQDPAANETGAALPGPDRWCWPHSHAMNSRELSTFFERVELFTAKGLTLAQGEALADRLVIRDREGLDVAACMECQHCTGRRCAAPARQGQGGPGRHAVDIHAIRDVLQRCPWFHGRKRQVL